MLLTQLQLAQRVFHCLHPCLVDQLCDTAWRLLVTALFFTTFFVWYALSLCSTLLCPLPLHLKNL